MPTRIPCFPVIEFEARTAVRINRILQNTGREERLIVTALENRPNDVSDLALIAKDNRILEQYQLKTGGKTIKNAVFDPKYAEMKIVAPPDQLQEIKSELQKAKNKAMARDKPLSPYWRKLEQAIHEGRLTDSIAGHTVPSYKEVEASGKAYLRGAYEALLPETPTLPSTASPTQKKAALKRTLRILPKTLGSIMKYAGPPIVIVGGGVDIAYGIHGWNESDRRLSAGELDGDIYYGKKTVAVTQIGLGTTAVVGGTVVVLNSAGIALFLAPEPVITKIAGITVIVTSVGLVVVDYALESIQGKRIESRQKLLQQIDEKTRQRLVIEQLQDMAKNPGVPLS